MIDDDTLRTLAEWSKGWEPIKELESEISEVWRHLRDLRVRVAEHKAHQLKTCPLSLTEVEARFWSKVTIVDDDDSCWEWNRARRPVAGEEYGLFRIEQPKNRSAGGTIGAHRFALMLTQGGKIPDHARHRCDNPPCCRPKHLEDGTHADNMRDRAKRGRYTMREQRGEANAIAVLTDAAVLDARRRYRLGETQQALADEIGVSRDVLGYALRGETWQHLDEIEPPVRNRRGARSSLTEFDVRTIRERARTQPVTVVAADYPSVSYHGVLAIVRRKSWRHVE